jgi:predicted RNase H-like HicB family nuclease
MNPKTTKRQVKVLQYNAIFQEEKAGGYSVWIPSLPGCCSQGETFDEAVKNIREAIELYLDEVPAPNKEPDDAGVKQFLVPISVHYA